MKRGGGEPEKLHCAAAGSVVSVGVVLVKVMVLGSAPPVLRVAVSYMYKVPAPPTTGEVRIPRVVAAPVRANK